jgi:hypothetical protein
MGERERREGARKERERERERREGERRRGERGRGDRGRGNEESKHTIWWRKGTVKTYSWYPMDICNEQMWPHTVCVY